MRKGPLKRDDFKATVTSASELVVDTFGRARYHYKCKSCVILVLLIYNMIALAASGFTFGAMFFLGFIATGTLLLYEAYLAS